MKSRCLLGAVLSVTLAALPAAAVDKDTFKCESKSSAAVNKWGGARGKCLVKCEQDLVKGGARICAVPPAPGFDGETTACVNDANAKYVGAVGKACPAGMPACGSYASQGATAYANSQITSLSAQIDPITVPQLMCDPALIKCEAKVVGTLAKLSGAIGKCLSKCYGALQLKGDPRQCTPDTVGDPFDTLDGETKACVDGAMSAASTKISDSCPTLPTCGILYPIGVSSLLNVVTGALSTNYSAPATNPFCASPSGAFLD